MVNDLSHRTCVQGALQACLRETIDATSCPHMQRSLAAKIWLRRFLEVIFFCVLWIPIILTGIGNIRQQTGYGQVKRGIPSELRLADGDSGSLE